MMELQAVPPASTLGPPRLLAMRRACCERCSCARWVDIRSLRRISAALHVMQSIGSNSGSDYAMSGPCGGSMLADAYRSSATRLQLGKRHPNHTQIPVLSRQAAQLTRHSSLLCRRYCWRAALEWAKPPLSPPLPLRQVRRHLDLPLSHRHSLRCPYLQQSTAVMRSLQARSDPPPVSLMTVQQQCAPLLLC